MYVLCMCVLLYMFESLSSEFCHLCCVYFLQARPFSLQHQCMSVRVCAKILLTHLVLQQGTPPISHSSKSWGGFCVSRSLFLLGIWPSVIGITSSSSLLVCKKKLGQRIVLKEFKWPRRLKRFFWEGIWGQGNIGVKVVERQELWQCCKYPLIPRRSLSFLWGGHTSLLVLTGPMTLSGERCPRGMWIDIAF